VSDVSHLASTRPRRQKPAKPPIVGDENLTETIASSGSWAEVLRRLGRKDGGAQASLKRRAAQMGIDTSHFLCPNCHSQTSMFGHKGRTPMGRETTLRPWKVRVRIPPSLLKFAVFVKCVRVRVSPVLLRGCGLAVGCRI
jgi:hypothetical protein